MAKESTAETRSLTGTAARGFVWLLGGTVGSKLINIVGNVVLAWLLLEEDFGLIGLAFTFTVFATLFQGQAILDVLIHRHTRFRLWSNAAFWLAIAMGLVSAGGIVALSPVAAVMYGDSRLVGLLCVLAIMQPIGSVAIVSEARLHGQLQFRTLAFVGTGSILLGTLLKVLFALLGFGAYSFAIPEPIVQLVRAIVLLRLAPPILRPSIQFRRWKYLFGDSMRLLLANFVITMTLLGDCVVLGVWYNPTIVGIYFFAKRNSAQTVHLLTRNLANVLFPSLRLLQSDVKRQTRAFLRASRVLAIIGVPMCLLQAGLADPVVRILFEERWYPSIPILQVLSVGMALRLVSEPSISLLKAQGRFGVFVVLSFVAAIVFYAFVIVGTVKGALGVSVGVAAWLAVFGPIQLYVAIRPGGGVARDVGRVYLAPLVAAATAVGAGVGLATLLPATLVFRDAFEVVVVTVTTGAIYIPILCRASPADVKEITSRLGRFTMFRRFTRTRDGASERSGGSNP